MNITMSLLSTLCFIISLVLLSNRVKVEFKYKMVLVLKVNGERNALFNTLVTYFNNWFYIGKLDLCKATHTKILSSTQGFKIFKRKQGRILQY